MSRWRSAVLTLVALAQVVVLALRSDERELAAWQALVNQLLLIALGGLVVAALAAGVHAWRSADHA